MTICIQTLLDLLKLPKDSTIAGDAQSGGHLFQDQDVCVRWTAVSVVLLHGHAIFWVNIVQQ